MIGKRGELLLWTVAIIWAATGFCNAQSLPPMTRHVREVTVNGQAFLVGHLPATQSMRLVLILPHRNQAGLDSFLKKLYDPSSASYRKFLSVEEFTARFGPSPEDYDSVIRFAKANGLEVVGTSRNRMNVDVKGPVAAVEKAFHLTMSVYQHPTEDRTFFAPDREPTPDMPVSLWHIAGLDNYSIPHPLYVEKSAYAKEHGIDSNAVIDNSTTGSGPSASFLGSDMRAAYYGETDLDGSGQSLGLMEYYGTDLDDLAAYFAKAGQTNNVPVTLLSTDGTSTTCFASDPCDDTEQTIDMTQAISMAPGLSSLVVYIGSAATTDDAAILNAMATANPLNAQLSDSWSWNPADPDTDNPYFEEFAAQGQNFFQASGDNRQWTSFSQIWPADNVYVTAVGGTALTTTGPGGAWRSETAWSEGGGGISPDQIAIPLWQANTAAGCSQCSQAFRNGPDVSANAYISFFVCSDQAPCTANHFGGTSFAAPMWAGFLALANEQAVSNGEPPLGFINPVLYVIGLGSNGNVDFHDITSGNNGYPATIGYDLATGWGSPNGSSLIDALVETTGFTLFGLPTSVSVVQGGTGTSTVINTVTGGFDTAVALSATGQPDGVTVGFSPTSITGNGTSAAALTVASSVAPGIYPITVTGIAGSVVETTMVSLTVTAATTTALVTSSNPSIQGKPVTFTATVSSSSGTPTGKVQFLNGASVLATVTLTSGSAKYASSKLPLNSNSITAVYQGNSSYGGSASSAVNQIVLATTSTSLAPVSNLNPSVYGQPVLFSATVASSSGTPPDGETVNFEQGATVLGTGTLSGGTATFSDSTLPVGTMSVKAVYPGDANFATSTSTAVNQVVGKAASTTTLTSSQNPSTYAQSVTFTATVAPQFSGTPAGSVMFYNGTTMLGSATLVNGVASYTTSRLAVGTAQVTAVYKGGTSFLTSSSAAVSQVVTQAGTATTLGSSLNPSNSGQPVTFTVTVAGQFGGTVTGSVTFIDGTTTLKTLNLSGGAANYSTSALASGTHNITANYNGSANFTTSSGAVTQTVN